MQDELDDWFMILLGPWERDDQPEEDPEVVGVPGNFLRQLRALIPDWRQLQIGPDDTVGCYEEERLRVGFEIGDEERKLQLVILRIEFSDSDWQGAWADATDGITAPTMAGAYPYGEVVGGPITSEDGDAEIEEALTWLRTQLQRPLERLDWPADRDGAPAGELWRFADTEERLVASGTPGDPANAVATRLRP